MNIKQLWRRIADVLRGVRRSSGPEGDWTQDLPDSLFENAFPERAGPESYEDRLEASIIALGVAIKGRDGRMSETMRDRAFEMIKEGCETVRGYHQIVVWKGVGEYSPEEDRIIVESPWFKDGDFRTKQALTRRAKTVLLYLRATRLALSRFKKLAN